MARDQATLDNAKVDLQRYQNLIKTAAITKQQLDTQVATVKQTEGTVKNDQGAIDSARLQITYCTITAPPYRQNWFTHSRPGKYCSRS
jgi:membrane fusion protein, multidrug efflux system